MWGGCACIEVVEEVVDVQSRGGRLTTPKAHMCIVATIKHLCNLAIRVRINTWIWCICYCIETILPIEKNEQLWTNTYPTQGQQNVIIDQQYKV
jgi:hypothetical protein